MAELEKFYIQQIEPLIKASNVQPHPNFFIVGGMRCGTTSLWSYLRQHPEIYMPRHKEPIFFCTSHKSRQCIRDFVKYLNLFSGVTTEKAIGEASAAYLTSPESAKLIHSAYPNAKIIISLRNPVEQIISVYQWMIREGWEWISPFEKALQAEQERWKDEQFKQCSEYHYIYFYSRFALYAEQISRYFDLFPKEQIKIILFDDFKESPSLIIRELYDFLGVNPQFTPKLAIHNEARIPLFILGHFFLKKRIPIILARYHIPVFLEKWFVKHMINMNISLGRYRHFRIDPFLKKDLLDNYKEDICKTSKIIGRNLDNWLHLS